MKNGSNRRQVACDSSTATLSLRLAILLALASLLPGRATAQYSGMIWTRPVCVPGVPGNCPNYLQGADPIRRSNGDVDIVLNGGHLGDDSIGVPHGNWEGLFVLRYPVDEHLPVRWYPLWASNDWGTAPARQELEAAYPSAVRYQGTWRIAFSSTTSQIPYASPNRDRVGRVDPPGDLIARASSSNVVPYWVLPVKPECAFFGSNGGACTGYGSGLLPSFFLSSSGTLFLYHADGTASCPSNWVRHEVTPSMTYQSPSCVTFVGGPVHEVAQVSDIARGPNGRALALINNPTSLTLIREWQADETGLIFTPTGRTWEKAPTDDASVTIWDGAFLKTEDRAVVTPKVVVANRSLVHWNNAAYGDWHLVWWADAGADLPARFGSAGSSCGFGDRPSDCPPGAGPGDTYGFQGSLDDANCGKISGWLWDPSHPETRLYVDLYEGSTLLGRTVANRFRPDLSTAGIGDGAYAYVFDTPLSLRDGAAHLVSVVVAGTGASPGNSPRTLLCNPSVPDLRGSLEGASCDNVAGWVWNASQPESHLSVEIVADGNVVTTAEASQFRSDLAGAGVGDGDHAFAVRTPDIIRDGLAHNVTVRVAGSSFVLPGSPKTVSCSSLGLRFWTLTPCRLLDSRSPSGPLGGLPLPGYGTVQLPILGDCGIPPEARALAANYTVIPSVAGHLKAFPADLGTEPAATVVSFRAGAARANNGLLRLGADEYGSVKLVNSSGGSLHVIIDVVGYFR